MKRRVSHKDLTPGTIFTMPLSDHRLALGQIVVPGIEFLLAGYLPLVDRFEPGSLSKLAPAVCGLTTDAPFYKGQWTIVGHAQVDTRVPLPLFKVKHYGRGEVVEDVNRKVVREANSEDLQRLGNRTNWGPKNITDAIEVLAGGGVLDDFHRQLGVTTIRSYL